MVYTEVILTHFSQVNASLPIISISNSVKKKLKIPMDYPLQLTCGVQQYKVICRTNNSKANVIQLDASLAQALALPDQSQLLISYNASSQEINLGPIFAILVSGISKSMPPFHKLNSFCEEVIRCARNRNILAYVTTISELSREKGNVVYGWTYYNHRWHKTRFPFPQVVYNRLPSIRAERTEAFKECKRILNERKMHLFNQTFLNKWEVHEILKENKELQVYLPKTHLFTGPLTLKSMIEQYSVLFIKPVHGSLGRGIYRISRGENGFISQYTTLNGQIQKNFSRLSQLYNYLSKRVNPKKYIIQQGIPLIKLNGRPVDFRALMQKNKAGEWSITSMVARIGPANRFVSNIARGGELSRVGTALMRCQVSQPKKVKQELLLAAKKSCAGIEAAFKDQFGELGVDLTIDRAGRIYILEINSKPSKTDDSISLPQAKGRPSVHRLLDYTQFLTKYTNK